MDANSRGSALFRPFTILPTPAITNLMTNQPTAGGAALTASVTASLRASTGSANMKR